MKADIHPDYVVTQVTCTCGNSFVTRSTARADRRDGGVSQRPVGGFPPRAEPAWCEV